MDKKLPASEEKFQIALLILNKLSDSNLITDEEKIQFSKELKQTFHPYITQLLDSN